MIFLSSQSISLYTVINLSLWCKADCYWQASIDPLPHHAHFDLGAMTPSFAPGLFQWYLDIFCMVDHYNSLSLSPSLSLSLSLSLPPSLNHLLHFPFLGLWFILFSLHIFFYWICLRTGTWCQGMHFKTPQNSVMGNLRTGASAQRQWQP